MPQEETSLRMIIFAGPNGSGKSTVTDTRAQGFPGIYINADDIARTEVGHIGDPVERNMEAARLAARRRNDALDQRRSFALEKGQTTAIAYRYENGKLMK